MCLTAMIPYLQVFACPLLENCPRENSPYGVIKMKKLAINAIPLILNIFKLFS